MGMSMAVDLNNGIWVPAFAGMTEILPSARSPRPDPNLAPGKL